MKKLLSVALLGLLSLPVLEGAAKRDRTASFDDDEKNAAVSEEIDAPMCAICHDTFIDEDKEVRSQNPWITTCSHYFHAKCLNRWLATGKQNCPLCLQKLDDAQVKGINNAVQSNIPAWPAAPAAAARDGEALSPEQLRARQEKSDGELAQRLQAEFDGVPYRVPEATTRIPARPAVTAAAAPVVMTRITPSGRNIPIQGGVAETLYPEPTADSYEGKLHMLLQKYIDGYASLYKSMPTGTSRIPEWPAGDITPEAEEEINAALNDCSNEDILQYMYNALEEALFANGTNGPRASKILKLLETKYGFNRMKIPSFL
jgi:hypothetical protein